MASTQTTVLALRMLFSLPIFAAVATIETMKAHRTQPALDGRTRWRIVVLGLFGYYLSSFLDFWGLEFISASLERLILFLNPTLVLLIGLMFLNKPVARAQWIAMIVSYAGIVLVFAENLRVDGAHVALGAALVFGAALSYAIYLLLSGELLKRLGSLRLVAYAMCVSTVACLAHFAITNDVSDLVQPRSVYLLSAINALFCTVVPVYFTMFAIDRVGPASTSQTAMVGPVSLLFLGWWDPRRGDHADPDRGHRRRHRRHRPARAPQCRDGQAHRSGRIGLTPSSTASAHGADCGVPSACRRAPRCRGTWSCSGAGAS
jgi:drug/metabolite transporter (DMT)-like permease